MRKYIISALIGLSLVGCQKPIYTPTTDLKKCEQSKSNIRELTYGITYNTNKFVKRFSGKNEIKVFDTSKSLIDNMIRYCPNTKSELEELYVSKSNLQFVRTKFEEKKRRQYKIDMSKYTNPKQDKKKEECLRTGSWRFDGKGGIECYKYKNGNR